MIGNAALARVHGTTAESLLIDLFACGGLDERWSCEEDAALVGDDNVFVRECGNIGATRDADSMNYGDLRDTASRHLGLDQVSEWLA